MSEEISNWVRKTEGEWEYELTKVIIFTELTGGTFGHFKAYAKKSKQLLIEGRGDRLLVYPGYRYDGCTKIGRIYETNATLMAACLHDAMYQVGKQVGYNAVWTLKHADQLFLWTMKSLGVSWFVRNIWYTGVVTLGTAWKMNMMDTLDIVESKAKDSQPG